LPSPRLRPRHHPRQGLRQDPPRPTFNKPNKRNGALLLRQDGNGWCIAYDGGGELSWFSDPRGPRAWTEEEKNAWKRKQAEAQRERAAGWANPP